MCNNWREEIKVAGRGGVLARTWSSSCALALSGTRPKPLRTWKSTASRLTKRALCSTIRYREQLTTQIIPPKKPASSRWGRPIPEISLLCVIVIG